MNNYLKGVLTTVAVLLILVFVAAGYRALALTSTRVPGGDGSPLATKHWFLGGDTASPIEADTVSDVADINSKSISTCTIYNNAGTATVKIWYGRRSTDSTPVTYWAAEVSVAMTSGTQETYGMEPLYGDSLKIEVVSCSSCKVRALCYVRTR